MAVRLVQRMAWLLASIAPLLGGCNQNPFTSPQTTLWQQQPQPPQTAQVQELDRRASQLDANNRDLHTQLARSQQQVRLLRDQVALLQGRLSETAGQLRDMQVAKEETDKQVQALQTSSRLRGGAAITANNSLRKSLQAASIPGFEVRQDGDVIRIELPSDQLFHPGTARLQYTASPLIDQVANALASNYRRQIVGIEGYWDSGAPGGGFTSAHQLTAAQAMAIFDQLTQRDRFSPRQLFVLSHGANHPLASNGTPAGRAKNRRIELVVYPETIDSP